MSYDRNVYIGWFAEFTAHQEKRKSGTKTIRVCPTSKKHNANGKFCPKCGCEIQEEEQDIFDSFKSPHNIYYAEDEADLNFCTLDKGSMKDLKEIKKSYMIFPEYVSTDDYYLFSPGFKVLSDVSRNDGLIEEVDFNNKPSEEWIETIKRLFCVDNVKIKFGAVLEVV